MKKIAVLLALSSALVFAQQKGSFTDPRDGKRYKTVKIGSQVWMAENLNYNAKGSGCYDDKPANCAKYGRLYNWSTAKTACPSGWQLPSNEEWQELVDLAGGNEVAGAKLKARSDWSNDLVGKSGNGTDTYGFSALPSGGGYSIGDFDNVGTSGYWWSSTEYTVAARAYRPSMHSMGTFVGWLNGGKTDLNSVRCLMSIFSQNTFTDSRDGKKYKYVKIGTQTWMAENLNYNASGSKCYDNKPANCQKYGRLYNWETSLKACPKGWHLPSDDEWQELVDFAGGDDIAGYKLKASSGWYDDGGKSGNGEDKFGFAALPGGDGFDFGGFLTVGVNGFWWSATEFNASGAYFRSIIYTLDDVCSDLTCGGRLSDYGTGEYNLYAAKTLLQSVRCLKD